jgi:hypothetical protein
VKQIDTGRYVCQAVQGQIYENEDPDKAPQVGVELRVVEGPDTGKTIFWYGGLKEGRNQEITFECLRKMGWRCNDVTALDGLGSIKVVLVGKRDEYKGKPQQKWDVYEIKTPKPTLEADKKASFANRFKALAASIAPLEVTPLNAAGALPDKIENGNGQASTGPATTGGVPF